MGLKARERRWIFAAGEQTIDRIRQLADQEPADVIARMVRAPNVSCIYRIAKYRNIALTAAKRGGPTLAHDFTHETFRNLQLAGARLGLDRYEVFQKFCDAAFAGTGAIDLIVNMVTEGAPE